MKELFNLKKSFQVHASMLVMSWYRLGIEKGHLGHSLMQNKTIIILIIMV